MKLYRNINEINFDNNRAITVGGFDGIHLGHQKIFATLLARAKERNLKTLVITFEPPPKCFFNLDKNHSLLTPINEKLKIFENKNIDEVLVIDFNEEFSKMSAYSFIELLISKIGFKVYVIGNNHTFGNNCKGNLALLEKIKNDLNYQFEIYMVDSFSKNNDVISSTLIKNQFSNKNIEYINELLGYNYFILSEVIVGNKIGRKLGFPTANLTIPNNKIIPKNGVYLVQVEIKNNKYFGIANVGVRPTIKEQKTNTPYIEVYLLDFDSDIYGVKLCVNFLKYIRKEQKFDNTDELISQISKDVAICRFEIEKNKTICQKQ